jgi:hypothetical protein
LIDYTKILLLNINIQRLLNHPDLKFETLLSEKTGEISDKKVAEYHYCKIIIHKNNVMFSGSIHKMWNSLNETFAPNHIQTKKYKGYNGNQFDYNAIIKVRKHLERLFNCCPKQMLFQNIEFGVNTTLSFSPNLFLKGLLYHFNKLFEYRFNGNFAQVIHQRYLLKIYNKSYQYGITGNLLRVELKIIKTVELKKIGVVTFADINKNTLDKAKQLLLRRFDEVMYYDYTIRKNKLSNHNKIALMKYSNPRYWINYLKPKHRDRHKKRLAEITDNYSDNLHRKIRQDILEKCVIINRPSNTSKRVINNYSSIGLISTQIFSNLTRLENNRLDQNP